MLIQVPNSVEASPCQNFEWSWEVSDHKFSPRFFSINKLQVGTFPRLNYNVKPHSWQTTEPIIKSGRKLAAKDLFLKQNTTTRRIPTFDSPLVVPTMTFVASHCLRHRKGWFAKIWWWPREWMEVEKLMGFKNCLNCRFFRMRWDCLVSMALMKLTSVAMKGEIGALQGKKRNRVVKHPWMPGHFNWHSNTAMC